MFQRLLLFRCWKIWKRFGSDIAQNLSKELNQGIIRLLEFREKIFIIQNFDILSFSNTYSTIQIQEDIPTYEKYDRYATFFVEILKGIVGRMKFISSKIQDEDSRDRLIKEVIMSAYFIDSVHLSERKGAIEILFLKLAAVRSQVLKLGKRFKHRFGDLYEAVYRELWDLKAGEKSDSLKKWAEIWSKKFGAMNRYQFNMEKCMDIMVRDTEEKRKKYEKGRSGPAERQEKAPFGYVQCNQEEIRRAHTWRNIFLQPTNQTREVELKPTHIEGLKSSYEKMFQKLFKIDQEGKVRFIISGNDTEEGKEWSKLFKRWVLKPKKKFRFKFKKKKFGQKGSKEVVMEEIQIIEVKVKKKSISKKK
jgi:hypothetical protein